MDDVVIINFKNIHNQTFNTFEFKKSDSITSVKERWSTDTKCNPNYFSFKICDGTDLPSFGPISNILRGQEFSLGLCVESNQTSTDNPCLNVDIVLSNDCNDVKMEESFVTVKRQEFGVSVSDLRAIVTKKVGKEVELYLNKWNSNDGDDRLDESLDGYINCRGEKCEAALCDSKEEHILTDSDHIPIVNDNHSPIVKWRPAPNANSQDHHETDSVSSNATFRISFLQGADKRSFDITVSGRNDRVPVRDLREAVVKELGFPVNLRQKRGSDEKGDEVALTLIGYVGRSGLVTPISRVCGMKNILLQNSDPDLMVPAKSNAVIRASKS